jgi:DNA replication protein DnaC
VILVPLLDERSQARSLRKAGPVHFSVWAEIFGEAVAVEAMVDRLVQHSHALVLVLVLKGGSYRLKEEQHEVIAAAEST